MKKLISLFIPSNAKLAAKAAASIKDGVNSQTDERKAVVAKYATLANELSNISATLTKILEDGNIDTLEETTLAALIEPLFAKAREIIGI